MEEFLKEDRLMRIVNYGFSFRKRHTECIFWQSKLSTFTAYCYTKGSMFKMIMLSLLLKISDHDRVAFMSCLQKVVEKTECKHVKSTRMFMFGVMEWVHNLDPTLF